MSPVRTLGPTTLSPQPRSPFARLWRGRLITNYLSVYVAQGGLESPLDWALEQSLMSLILRLCLLLPQPGLALPPTFFT